jgi:hypothetical protein
MSQSTAEDPGSERSGAISCTILPATADAGVT